MFESFFVILICLLCCMRVFVFVYVSIFGRTDPKDTKVLQRRRRLQYSGMDTVARGLKNAAKILEICTSWRFWNSLKQSLRLKGRKKRMKKEKVTMKLMNLRDTIFSKKQHSHFLTHPLCTSSTAAKHLTPHKHII